jgi:probable phosphoglycerate mutase
MGSPEVAPPGGESFADTLLRVAALKDEWLAAGPATILAVSHVSPIKSFAQLALDASAAVLYRLHLDLCGLTTLDWYADGPASVRGWNALT